MDSGPEAADAGRGTIPSLMVRVSAWKWGDLRPVLAPRTLSLAISLGRGSPSPRQYELVIQLRNQLMTETKRGEIQTERGEIQTEREEI